MKKASQPAHQRDADADHHLRQHRPNREIVVTLLGAFDHRQPEGEAAEDSEKEQRDGVPDFA